LASNLASADNLEIRQHQAKRDNLASADDLDLRDNLASAVDLENHHNQTLPNPTATACKNKSRPREAVKFNVQVHAAGACELTSNRRCHPLA